MSCVVSHPQMQSQWFWLQDRVRTNIGSGLTLAGLFLSKPVHIASKPLIRSFATPIRPGVDGNYPSPLLERIWRVFISTLCIATSPVTVGMALTGALLGKIGDVIKRKPHTHFRGDLSEKLDTGSYRLMTMNACMLWGGLPIPLGGMRPPCSRMDAVAQKIQEVAPDVLVMQEMAFDSGFSLFQRLKGQYAHFYTRIGPNPPLMESGLFVASKYRVLRSGFIPFPKQVGIYRGAFWIETPKSFIFTTHMEFGYTEEGKEKRKAQLALILEQMEKFKGSKPCFLLGDFNLDRSVDNDYFEANIPKDFHDPYYKKHPKLDEESATCTDVISAYTLGDSPPKKRWEMIDYALLAKGSHDKFKLDVNAVPMYDNNQPYSALSDHKALVLTAKA